MAVKYSYENYTTKGHGVIEYGPISKKKRSKSNKRKNIKTNIMQTSYEANYKNLYEIQQKADSERQIEYYKQIDKDK